MSNDPNIERDKQGRVICTVTYTEEQVNPARNEAIKKLGANKKVDGFRPGTAPEAMLIGQLDPEDILEETVRNLLPDTFKSLTEEHTILPIIPPKVEAVTKEPLVLKVIFVEKPTVKIKGVDKIKIPKTEPKVDEKDVQKMMDYILKQHEKTEEVDRAAKEGDKVTMDFYANDVDGKEIENTRSEDYSIVIGSKMLIPGFEEELIGLNKEDDKSFEITFPENYQAEHLRNQKATFYVHVKKIEEVTAPELTDDFVKTQLHGESVENFKKEVEKSMIDQEKDVDSKRREQLLFDEILKMTTVDLPDELVDEELRQVVEELQEQLQQQNMTMEQWIEATGKKPEALEPELRERAKSRVTLRLGMQAIIEEKDIQISDEDMTAHIETFLAPLQDEDRVKVAPAYEKGQNAYEQLKWQKKVDSLLDMLLA